MADHHQLSWDLKEVITTVDSWKLSQISPAQATSSQGEDYN